MVTTRFLLEIRRVKSKKEAKPFGQTTWKPDFPLFFQFEKLLKPLKALVNAYNSGLQSA